jgi:hypothetical protein
VRCRKSCRERASRARLRRSGAGCTRHAARRNTASPSTTCRLCTRSADRTASRDTAGGSYCTYCDNNIPRRCTRSAHRTASRNAAGRVHRTCRDTARERNRDLARNPGSKEEKIKAAPCALLSLSLS